MRARDTLRKYLLYEGDNKRMEFLPIGFKIMFYVLIFLYGTIIGSFLNVVILRTPIHETIVSKRSHCMSCGYQLAWFDLVPLFSWLFLGGKCRKCKAKISAQYPIVEAVTGVLFVLTALIKGLNVLSILDMLVISALLALSVIDARTMEIPFGINVFIFCMGIIKVVYSIAMTIINPTIAISAGATQEEINLAYFGMSFLQGETLKWSDALIGFFIVSVPLYIAFLVTKGKGMGGGDIKLMAAAGLFLGWYYIVAALIVGCLLCVIIHPIRMKFFKAEHKLAMGPYLSAGILISIWFGYYLVYYYVKFMMSLI